MLNALFSVSASVYDYDRIRMCNAFFKSCLCSEQEEFIGSGREERILNK